MLAALLNQLAYASHPVPDDNWTGVASSAAHTAASVPAWLAPAHRIQCYPSERLIQILTLQEQTT